MTMTMPPAHHTECSFEVSRLNHEDLRKIALRIISVAVNDAMGKRVAGQDKKPEEWLIRDAREWLLSHDAAMYYEITGVNDAKIRAWVKAGCPAPEEETKRILK